MGVGVSYPRGVRARMMGSLNPSEWKSDKGKGNQVR